MKIISKLLMRLLSTFHSAKFDYYNYSVNSFELSDLIRSGKLPISDSRVLTIFSALLV